jgi:hypothetical protein
VRDLAGAKLTGSFKGERFILGDCDADSGMDSESMYTVFAPEGPVIMMPMRDGRARLMAEIHDEPGAALNIQPTQDALQKILDDRVGGVTITRSHWRTCFEIHHGQGGRLPVRPGVPRRRLRTHSQPRRRTGHEQGHAGCVQPRLEAGGDGPGRRRRCASGQLPP